MTATERTARETARSDYADLRNKVAELGHGNSGRVDLFDIASTGFVTGWFEYLPDTHSGIVRIVIAGIKPRDRAPTLMLGALEHFRTCKPQPGAEDALESLLKRVAAKDTWRIDVFKLPEGGFRGIAEYMPKEGSVMVRVTLQSILERDRIETLLLRVLEDLIGRVA